MRILLIIAVFAVTCSFQSFAETYSSAAILADPRTRSVVTGGVYTGIEIGWDIVQRGSGDGLTYKYTFEDFVSLIMMAPSIAIDGQAPNAKYINDEPEASFRLMEGPNGLGQRDVLPEPNTLALIGVGLVALGVAMRRTVKRS